MALGNGEAAVGPWTSADEIAVRIPVCGDYILSRKNLEAVRM